MEKKLYNEIYVFLFLFLHTALISRSSGVTFCKEGIATNTVLDILSVRVGCDII